MRDANGCIYSTSATVASTSGPTAIATTVVDASCGASNGSFTLGAVTGGCCSLFTYSVDASPFTSTTSYTNLIAGPHSIDVRDVNGCIFSTFVSNTAGPTAIATTVVDATCGTSNGSITLGAVTGEVAPYIYSVDASAFTSTTGYSNLSAGSHPIQVKDVKGCISPLQQQ